MDHPLLDLIVEATVFRPGAKPAQIHAALKGLVGAIEAYLPRDPIEIMLAGMIVTHLQLILDATRDLFQCDDIRTKIRLRGQIVSLNRAMLSYMKELRVAAAREPVEEAEPEPEPVPVHAPPEAAPRPRPPPAPDMEARLAAFEMAEDQTDEQSRALVQFADKMRADTAAFLYGPGGLAGARHPAGGAGEAAANGRAADRGGGPGP